MDEREPVQVSFRLPAGALEGFSRLVEQLRLLAQEVGGGTASPASAPAESGRNEAFDSQKYEGLRQEAEMRLNAPETVRAEFFRLEDAQAVRSEAAARVEEPAGAAEAVSAAPGDAASVKAEVPPEESREERTEERGRQEPQEEPEVVRAGAESPLEGPEAVRMEPESQIPAAEEVWAESGREMPEVQAVRVGAFFGGAEARTAGFALESAPAEVSGKWSSVTQELAAEGPAPLTAEAVSLAFRRDGRRYDNGFPLY